MPSRAEASARTVKPSAPKVEHLTETLGVGTPTPRLSWIVGDAPGGWRQRAYQIRSLRGGAYEIAPWIDSEEQSLVPWPGSPLASRERASVEVRVRDEHGTTSAWSPATSLEAGLFEAGDWQARAITPSASPEDRDLRRPPLLRHEFEVTGEVARARLYYTAHGVVELELNGARVGSDVLTPGWTVYPARLFYATHDVTDLVAPGRNALGAMLGDGWYRGRLGFDGGTRDIYGDRLALIAQLEIDYRDGRRETIASAPGWRAGMGGILYSGLYEGESFDRNAQPDGWSCAGFDDSDWSPVDVVQRDPSTLVAATAPPIRRTQEVEPVSVVRTRRGSFLLDFGQNLVGRLRIRVDGVTGTKIVLRHAEVLENGELCVRPLRAAASVDEYVLGPGGPQDWEPRFTLHGFRYAEIEGWPGSSLEPGSVVAQVVHTDMRRTGGFSCSDPRLNRLHENVVWSTRGNFVGLPTDCPQRDERLGWTGDIQIFAPTATYLFDCAALLASWLEDLALEQLPDGTVPWFVPSIYGNPMWSPPRPGAAWGDAAVIVPWSLYERFGDVEVLRRQYPSAKAWVECVERLAGPGRLWDTGFQLGDWLDPAAPADDPGAGTTDRYLVATAYFARSSRLLSQTAKVLGYDDEHKRFAALAQDVTAAFVARYTLPSGRMTSDSATAYALAIAFELLPPDRIPRAGDRLAEIVRSAGDVVTTGFVGTPVLLDALAATGHLDRAYAVLTQTACPSWLYMVDRGATTIWERWDSMLPDGTVNPGDMTSFNHYALGAVADWLHTAVAGIRQVGPRGDRFLIRPRPGGGLTWARGWLETTTGRIEASWRILDDDRMSLQLVVPVGTTAQVELTDGTSHVVATGRHEFVARRESNVAAS